MQRPIFSIFMVMLMFSILPGCGKSKNANSGIVSGGAVGVPVPVGTGTGGCYNTSSIVNSGITLGFTGTNTALSGVTSYMPLYGYGSSIPGGYTNTYWRTTSLGDRVDIALSGTSIYAQVSASASAVAYINVYGGGQICGFYINANALSPAVYGSAWSGTLSGTITLLTAYQGVSVQL